MAAAAPLSPFQPFQPKEFIQEYKAPEIDFDKPPFDPAQIHAKYAEERQKRIREDGNEQYVNASEHRDYLTNPWEEELVREAVTDHDLDIVGITHAQPSPFWCQSHSMDTSWGVWVGLGGWFADCFVAPSDV